MLEALDDTPAVLVHGPRQSGKMTLTQRVGEERDYAYVTFDDANMLICIDLSTINTTRY